MASLADSIIVHADIISRVFFGDSEIKDQQIQIFLKIDELLQ
jgi:hypothetical protein